MTPVFVALSKVETSVEWAEAGEKLREVVPIRMSAPPTTQSRDTKVWTGGASRATELQVE